MISMFHAIKKFVVSYQIDSDNVSILRSALKILYELLHAKATLV